jgi:hypothetical protein
MEMAKENILMMRVKALMDEIACQPGKADQIMSRVQEESPEIVMALARISGHSHPDASKVLAANLLSRAGSGIGGMLISSSEDEHFDVIVEAMDMAGAKRLGSAAEIVEHRKYMIDVYKLPDGNLIKAGYEISPR